MIDGLGDGPIWAAGFMTGTSMDGVDWAAIETDGEAVTAFGSGATRAYDAETRDAAAEAIAWAAGQSTGALLELRAHRWRGVAEIDRLRTAMTRVHEDAVGDMPAGPVLAGVHGQTILHRPEAGLTCQIAPDAALGTLPTVVDFRNADLAAGGQGAPLAPFFHFALARYIGASEPLCFLNIGGVANLTWIDPSAPTPSTPGALVAFDTGPGNALIDDWMRQRTGASCDMDGAAAAAGTVASPLPLSNALATYLDAAPPKSLDRNDFATILDAVAGASTEDGAATLTEITAHSVAAAVPHLPAPPSRWLVCGGGRRNPSLLRSLERHLAASVETVEAVGLDGDLIEAQAFAFLAVRVLRGLPTSAPGTTGCREPVSGGILLRPKT